MVNSNASDDYIGGFVSTHYDENINMYNEPPTNIISLHDFYKLALDRL